MISRKCRNQKNGPFNTEVSSKFIYSGFNTEVRKQKYEMGWI